MRHPVQAAGKALAHQRPDGLIGAWAKKDPSSWTVHERLAARTLGVLTIANAVSLAGAALTASGIRDFDNGAHRRAVLKMGLGRGLDLVDGWISKRLGTNGVVGAATDAFLDKALAAYFMVTAVDKGHLSPDSAAQLLEQQLDISVTNFQIKRAGGEPNPSGPGKHGQALVWLHAGGIVLERAFDADGHATLSATTHDAAQGAGLFSIYLNQQAEAGYRFKLDELRSTS